MNWRPPWNLLVLAGKQVKRHRLRSLLTLAGVATGMFLFATVETMQSSLRRATETNTEDTVLVVYRENRYCPATSRLPEYYADQIARIPGVAEVMPIQVVVNNCGASLDVIAFRGVPPENLRNFAPEIEVVDGNFEDWARRSDAALLGINLAGRRDIRVGDQFDAAGVTVYVAALITSDGPQDNNIAYVHLPFLQQASRVGLGVVTQFNVRIQPSHRLDSVAQAIDLHFASDAQPTDTRPEKAFFASTARELVELVSFTRWMGLAAVMAVMGLVANTVLLAVRSRVTDHAIMMTLGFPDSAIGYLVMAEGLLLGLLGGAVGVAGATAWLYWQSFTLGNEGLTLAFLPDWRVFARGTVWSLTLGFLGGIYPAWMAMRQSMASGLREG